MDFIIPTTKEEMYATLSDIFAHYRLTRDGYDGVDLIPLEIEEQEFVPLTDSEIEAKAQTLVAAEQERELIKEKKSLEEKSLKCDAGIAAANAECFSLTEKIKKSYSAAIETLKKSAVKNGTAGSTLIADKMASLVCEREAKIAEAESKRDAETANLIAQKTAIATEIAALPQAFASVWGKDVNKKTVELKDAQAKTEREISQYNSTVYEKNCKYANSLVQIRAGLELRYLSIQATPLTKDELIEFGYYKDVIRCISGYYSQMSATAAYLDFRNELNLMIYLEDYYNQMLYNMREASLDENPQ